MIQVPEMDLPSGEFQALVIWLNDPSEIFIQIAIQENIASFGKLNEELYNVYETLPPGTYQPQVGEVCVTKTPDGWLRSLVLAKVAADSYRVQFVDYGNEEVIQGNIHKLDETLSKYPAVAGKCSLAGVGPASGGQWSDQAKEWLKKEVSRMSSKC